MNKIYTMKYINLAAIFIAVLLSVHGCKKYEGPNSSTAPNSSTNLRVNSMFNFETMQNVDISIQVQSSDARPLPQVIRVFDNNPGTTGKLITTGMTDQSLNYSATVRIPTALDTVWIERQMVLTDSTLLHQYQKVPVTARKINYAFSLLASVSNLKSAVQGDPGCSSGCTRTIASQVSTIQVNDDEQVCLTTSFIGNIVFTTSKGTAKLVICSAASPSSITVNGGGIAQIVISSSGSLTTNNFTQNKINISNYGTFKSTGSYTLPKDRTLTNWGLVQAESLTLTQGTLTNNGTCNITKEIVNSGTVINQNLLQISGSLVNNAGYSFANNCKVNIIGSFQHWGYFINEGYMLVSGEAQFYAGSKTTLQAQSNFEVASGSPTALGHLSINGDVTGPLKGCGNLTITGKTEILAATRFFNQLDICDADGIENLQITLPASVTQCKSFVPNTYCTPQSGTSQVRDRDGDGVPDILDDYPDNPDAAFTSFYPNRDTFATLCFSDIWPYKGDGSMNDFVVDFQYKIITNARNQVVDLYGTFRPRAEGAGADNCFAVSLPIPPSSVQVVEGVPVYGAKANNVMSLSPQGYENGHPNNTVFPVVNSVYQYYNANYYVNVWPMEDYFPVPETIVVHIRFNTPVPAAQLIPPFDPFLIHNHNRSNEVHLIDHPPTALAGTTLFGTGDDRSDPATGSWYRTVNNLPWALEIPASFSYTIAKTDLLMAYLKYAEWAQSGGTKSKDWYLDRPGYRNTKYIYNKK